MRNDVAATLTIRRYPVSIGVLMAENPQRLNDILDQLVDQTEDQEKVSIADLFDALDSRSYGPLLLLPALIAASPIGAIFGMSLLTGALIIVVAIQALFGIRSPWLPKKLIGASFGRDRLIRARDKTKPWIERFDKLIHNRLTVMTEPPFLQLVAVCCIALAITFFPLAAFPGAVFAPAISICLLALGLSGKDGYLIVAGLMTAAAAFGLLWYLL